MFGASFLIESETYLQPAEISHLLFCTVILMKYVLLVGPFLWNLHSQVYSKEQGKYFIDFGLVFRSLLLLCLP